MTRSIFQHNDHEYGHGYNNGDHDNKHNDLDHDNEQCHDSEFGEYDDIGGEDNDDDADDDFELFERERKSLLSGS